MKTLIKIFIFVFALVLMTACKNDKKDADVAPDDATHAGVNDGETIVRGEFIYMEDVAVLTTNSEIYEVVPDAKMKELAAQAKTHQKLKTDMVMTTLKVHIIPNPKRVKTPDVWEKAVEIKEIMEVKPSVRSRTVNIK